MKRVCAAAALLAAAVVLTGQNQLDYVRATNCGGHDSGFFVWGKIPGATLPAKATGGCGVDVSVGAVDPNSGGGNQLAAFTNGQAPQLLPKEKWKSTATHVVNFAAPAQVQVKIWILYLPTDCDLTCMRNWFSGFLVWANELLFRERAGFELAAADPAAVVTDATASNDNKVTAVVRDFQAVLEIQHCGGLSSLKDALYQDKVLNLYLVQTVGAQTARGTVCDVPPPVLDMAFAAHQASYGTMLHEIGHLLGLQHADYITGVSQKNLMISSADERNYLTEGQVFWMHFADRSVLPVELPGGAKGLVRKCNGTKSKPCPAWKEWIWQDP